MSLDEAGSKPNTRVEYLEEEIATLQAKITEIRAQLNAAQNKEARDWYITLKPSGPKLVLVAGDTATEISLSDEQLAILRIQDPKKPPANVEELLKERAQLEAWFAGSGRCEERCWQFALLYWRNIYQIVTDCPTPAALTTEDGNAQLVWSHSRSYLEIEFDGMGRIDWFAQNRQNRCVEDGTCSYSGNIPTELISWIRKISGSEEELKKTATDNTDKPPAPSSPNSHEEIGGFVKELGCVVRECIGCGCLVPNGPTRCKRCAQEAGIAPVGVDAAMLERLNAVARETAIRVAAEGRSKRDILPGLGDFEG